MGRYLLALLLTLGVITGCSSGSEGTTELPATQTTSMVWDNGNWNEKEWK